MTGDELYGIGSVSKIYTTAAVLKLAEQGRGLSGRRGDPVSQGLHHGG